MTKMVTKILRKTPSCRSRRHVGQSRQPQVRPGLQLCQECRNELENHLIELPEWYERCEQILDYRRYRTAERSNGHNANVVRLGDDAVTVKSNMIATLSSWSGLVVVERGVTAPDNLDIQKLSGFLAIHLEWLTAHATAPDFADELAELAKAARAIVQAESLARVELGPCVQPGCRRTVYAMTHDEEGLVPYRVSCEAGHVWRPDQWLVLSGRLERARQAVKEDPSASGERVE
jgi:hypothetical protein